MLPLSRPSSASRNTQSPAAKSTRQAGENKEAQSPRAQTSQPTSPAETPPLDTERLKTLPNAIKQNIMSQVLSREELVQDIFQNSSSSETKDSKLNVLEHFTNNQDPQSQRLMEKVLRQKNQPASVPSILKALLKSTPAQHVNFAKLIEMASLKNNASAFQTVLASMPATEPIGNDTLELVAEAGQPDMLGDLLSRPINLTDQERQTLNELAQAQARQRATYQRDYQRDFSALPPRETEEEVERLLKFLDDAREHRLLLTSLIQAGLDPNQSLYMKPLLYDAIWRDDPIAIKMYCMLGADPNRQCSLGHTPLDLSTTKSTQVMQALLDAGANPNLPNRLGQSPLHIAVLNRKRDIAEQLLEAGAQVNQTDINNRTALDYAQRKSRMALFLPQRQEYTQLIRLLREYQSRQEPEARGTY